MDAVIGTQEILSGSLWESFFVVVNHLKYFYISSGDGSKNRSLRRTPGYHKRIRVCLRISFMHLDHFKEIAGHDDRSLFEFWFYVDKRNNLITL